MPGAPVDDAGTSPTAAQLRAAFEPDAPLTVGLEEELMLLDPETLDLLPRAGEVLALTDDARLKAELPAAQLEIVAPPAATVGEGAAVLRDARRALATVAADVGCLAGAGAHPFAAPEGVLTTGGHYDELAAEYGPIARRQLVSGLHVHVCVRGPDKALAVYNALRSYLPELAALAANAPFYGGADSGLASVRPKLAELLPRQGIPPSFASWDALAAALRWGAVSGRVPRAAQWWWEARLHLALGTVELRVCDAQSSVADSAAIGAVVHTLVAWLAARFEAGERLAVAPDWRIAENRWAACRHGLDATFADLRTGAVLPVRERLHMLLDTLAPFAGMLGCPGELDDARRLLAANGAERQRACGDAHAATAWLAGRFLARVPG